MTPSPPTFEPDSPSEAGKLIDFKTLLSGPRFWLGSIVIILAFFAGRSALEQRANRALSEDQQTTTAILFDAYSNGVTSVLYDSVGEIEYTLEASNQVHYLDNTTALSDPYVRLYQGSGVRWNIVARSGKIISAENDNRIDRLDLSDDVELFQIDALGNRMTLNTSFLSLYPSSETMNTDREVTMTTDTLRQTALGMTADLQQDTLTFLSQVKGRYEVQN
ncbi:MAG: LPS export ABC transporter periplasmic protein LptC [Gammaproteobacteria bacterium]